MQLILGSTSRYRAELLARLRQPFTTAASQVDETPLPGETPRALALRLARAKAQAVLAAHPQALVIGADQVADLDGMALGKPGTHAHAAAQLRRLSGREARFETAVAVARAGFAQDHVSTVTVRFRALTDAEIEAYLRLDEPYDCAGSAKAESLGVALLERIDSDDPTALIGLPLIHTCALLRAAGLDVLAAA